MVDSFFARPKKRKAAGKSGGRSLAPRSKRNDVNGSVPGRANGAVSDDDDDSIPSGSDEDNEVDDVSMEDAEDDSESDEETVADKRRRLAKQYLDNLREEEEYGDDFFDAADLDRDIIARRLKEDVAEEEGKIYRYIGDKLNLQRLQDSDRRVRIQKSQFYPLTSVATKFPYAFTTSKDGHVVKWDISSLDKAKRLKIAKRVRGTAVDAPGHWDEILCIAVSPDGKYVVTGGRDRRIVVWSAENLAFVKAFDMRDRKGVVLGLTFRRNTNELYAACADLKVRTFNLDQLAQVETLFGHQDQVADISALSQERCVTVGSRDRTAIIWKISEESRLTFRGGDSKEKADKESTWEGSIDCCSMIDNQLFVTGSDNGNIGLWSTQKKKPLYVHRLGHGKEDPLTPEQFTADTANLDSVDQDIPPPQPRGVTSIYAIPYSDVFFTGSWSGDIRIWQIDQDHRKFHLLGSVPGIDGVVNRISVVEAGARGKETFGLIAAVSKELRLGRWLKLKGAKNGILTAAVETKN